MKNLLKQPQNNIFLTKQSVFLGLVLAFICFALVLSSFDSTIYLKSVLGLLFLGLTWYIAKYHIQIGIYGLTIWFAFETILLKLVPSDLLVFAKYAPEVFLYILLASVLVQKISKDKFKFIKTPINAAFIAFIVVSLLSMLVNQTPIMVGLLGIRQLIRFVFVFYLILYSNISKKTIKNTLYIMIAIIAIQAVLAIAQYATHGAIDKYLISEESVFISSNIILDGVEQFWAEGQRVFGTFGRYNQLGSFLVLGLCLLVAFMYEIKKKTMDKKIFLGLIALSILTIILTYSRASWIAVMAGLGLITVIIKKDKKLIAAIVSVFIIAIIYISGYLTVNQLSVSTITEQRESSLIERVLEPFSSASLNSSYEGLGRVYFLVNTPRKIVANNPFLGVGPGMYGGGVAAALGNKKVYYEYGLPFGVYGEIGQIDNNWLSIWGELGTIGLILFIIIFVRLYKGAKKIYNTQKDYLTRVLSLSLRGMIIGVCVLGFFSPYFEIRTLMFYFWLIAGSTYKLGMDTNSH